MIKNSKGKIVAIVIAVLMIAAMAVTYFVAESGDDPDMQGQMNSEQQFDGNQEPPEKPDGEIQEPPEKPDGESGDMQQPPDMQGGMEPEKQNIKYMILFGLEGLVFALSLAYLAMTRGGRKTLKECSWIKGAAAAVAVIVIAGGCAFGGNAFIAKDGPKGMPRENMNEESVDAKGVVEVDGTEEEVSGENVSESEDENVVLVKNGGKASITGTIDKKSGDSSNTSGSDFSGVNAGILVQEKSSATIENADISTSAKGANAVFATGGGAKIAIKDSIINTSGESSSRGLDATYGGTIEADNVTIETKGGSCAALATDRGEGTVSAKNSTLTTNGAGSPIIYSTGDISIDSCHGTANGAQITVVEGKNTAKISNSKVTASGAGNRGDVDIAGVMIYQSMSGDADEGVGTFTADDSSLSIDETSEYYDKAPFFFITNTDAVIDLKNCDINYGSGILLDAKGTSEWGNEGSNGGDVEFNAENQILKGNIVLDKLSSLSLNLKNGSEYEGTINGENTAKEIKLVLSADSKLVLTGDSYITSLENEEEDNSNIDFNGYKLYVDGKEI